MRPSVSFAAVLSLLFLLVQARDSFAQGNLYTARGYWEETTKSSYISIKEKIEKGDSLTENEVNYVVDYERYLQTYYQRLSDDAKEDYARLKAHWDFELTQHKIEIQQNQGEFEWRARDRFANGFYGLYYGLTLVSLTDATDAAAVGLPLITSGLWMLGPAINPRKYDNIDRSVVRANNTGKLLGMGYGAALGMLITGSNENAGKYDLALSTFSSITLGEVAFYAQKRKKYSPGHIEIMRHYGFLGPWVGLSFVYSTASDNVNAAGGALLGGGIAGLIIGNHVAKKYDYTRGDVDAVSSLTLISTGVGFAGVTAMINGGSDKRGLILVPAAMSIIGTVWGQQQVRGARLTDKQGSTINFSTAGAALFGLGVVTLTQSNSSAVWIGVPSGLALIIHQILARNYKMKNLELNLQGSTLKKKNYNVSLKVTPESYLLNQQLQIKNFSPQAFARAQNPIFKLVITF